MDYVQKRTHRVDIHSPDHRGFARVGFRHNQSRNLPAAGFEGDGQRAANATNSTVERQLSNEQTVRDLILRETTVGSDDTERHRQVES